jgi:predicted MFS family arabinose efflux permease
MKQIKTNKWLQLVILALGAGAIYQFPYLRFAFYTQLQNALRLNNLQYGLTMSVYAVTAMIGYFPGGWLADRVSPKKLITFSLLITGLSGFVFATFPSYAAFMALNGLWGITTILTFWAALLKVTRALGDEKQQGRLFGFLEGIRGLTATLVSFILLAILSRIESNTLGMAAIIRIMSWLEIIIGAATFILIRDPVQKKDEAPRLKDIGKVIRMKEIWLICGVIFTSYSVYAGITYVAPFLQHVYGISEEFATSVNIFQRTAMMFLGGAAGGFLADKTGSRSKVMFISYIMLIATIVLILVLPASPNLAAAVIINILLMATAVYVLRGLYFSLTGEFKIPLSITGTVVGFASLIGYLPDIFIYPVIGGLLDKNEGRRGYVYMYLLMLALTMAGLGIMIRVRLTLRRQAGKDSRTPPVYAQ